MMDRKYTQQEWESRPLEEAELSTRAHGALYGYDFYNKDCVIRTFGDVINMSDAQLLRIPNFGKLSLEEVRKKIGGRRGYTSVRGALFLEEHPAISSYEEDLRRIVREELERYFGPKP